MSDSFWPHGMQHTRPPCPLLTPGACLNSCHQLIELVIPCNHLILCHPLLLLPSVFPSIRVFSNESVLCIRWPNYWSFSFGISPSSEYSGMISFRIDWSNLLAVQGTLKSLLQYHNSKGSILWCSAFFPYPVDLKFCALPDPMCGPWSLFQMWAIKKAIDYSSTVLGSSCHVVCHLKLAPTSLNTLLSTVPWSPPWPRPHLGHDYIPLQNV